MNQFKIHLCAQNCVTQFYHFVCCYVRAQNCISPFPGFRSTDGRLGSLSRLAKRSRLNWPAKMLPTLVSSAIRQNICGSGFFAKPIANRNRKVRDHTKFVAISIESSGTNCCQSPLNDNFSRIWASQYYSTMQPLLNKHQMTRGN